MKNKVFKLIIAFIFSILLLTGCGEKTVLSVNDGNKKVFSEKNIGKEAMIEIGSGLYYDSNTKIVYWWNGILDQNYKSTTPTPYLAPNGLPYRFNEETNKLDY